MHKTDSQVSSARPPFWIRLPVITGNLVQIVGLIIGAALMYLAAHLDASTLIRIILMILGWLTIYSCCHAIGHYVVGRLFGIRFRGYGIRGTDHPEEYGPGMRQLMSIFPMFTVMTEKGSLQKASSLARALMFGAGETSSTVCSILAGLYAWQSQTPGGLILLIVSVITSITATITTSKGPKGDYVKAWKAWREKTSNP